MRYSTRKVRIHIGHPGSLGQLGYSLAFNQNRRHRALSKAVSLYGYGPVMKKVNALYVFNLHCPQALRKLVNDKDWLVGKFR